MQDQEMTPMPVEDDLYSGVEGFEKKTDKPRGTYFSLFKWRLALRSKTLVEGWEGPFETRNPQTDEIVNSYAEFYDRLVVRIINITRDKKDFSATGGGKVINWNLRVMAGSKKATIQFTQRDSALKRFLKVARNINFDKPIMISAWEGKREGKSHQAISFYQPSDELIAGATTDEGKAKLKNLDNWTKIEEYWKRPVDPTTHKPIEDSDAVGADGTKLPRGVQDEDSDDWDYRDQDKFLIQQFREHIAPKMEVIAEKYGVNQEQHDENQTPEFSGGPQEQAVITEKPANPLATTMADAISGEQRATCLSLAQQIGIDANTISQKLVGANLDELSRDGASYVQYKMERRLAKMANDAPPAAAPPPAPVAPPPPPPPPPPAPVAPPAADDDDGWEEAAPAPTSTVAAPPKAPVPADDDDDGWGEVAANPPKPAGSTTAPAGNDPDDDIPF
jgi:hypothetical protein